MSEAIDGRGVLYPARLPTFHRISASSELQDLVRWFWIPRWNIASGRSSRQEILSFPASNLVVEPSRVSLSGPTTAASYRDLRGRGWAVGALLRPAAIRHFLAGEPIPRDSEMPLDFPKLHRAVATEMKQENETLAREGAVKVLTSWIQKELPRPDDGGLMANRMEDLIASNADITRIEHVAERLHLSVRAVQRLAQRYVGLPPLMIIRRYRLQSAAEKLRSDPTLSISRLATELGYSDQAHLAADFRSVLGFAASTYRREVRDD